ncbi:uncharacterized protein TrAtP1_001790 [Trichoderma atroviride]|uniref:uncharacterized protein n=1 Tax=Hypocrea atroviridis TaxID=63577 RepID=UPI003318C99A|nr:hypothetical protein TrAtP1_001790 [Trichoderma atroviride]
MLGQCFANPVVLTLVCADEDDEVAPGGIVGVEEVCDKAHLAQPAGQDHEFIFGSKLLEQLLLVFLCALC